MRFCPRQRQGMNAGMQNLTRRMFASAACAGILLFGAACGGDDGDPAVDVDVDEEQLEEDLNETGEDVGEGLDEAEDTVDENVDIGDDAEDQGD